VLFDLGNTLIYEQAQWDGLLTRADVALWQTLRQQGVRLRASDVYGQARTLFELYGQAHDELSEPGIGAVLDGLLRAKGYELSREQLREAIRAMYGVAEANWQVEEDAIPTLEELKRGGYRIGLISNSSDDEHTQVLVDKAGVRPHLEHILSSAAFGKRKPEPSIFRAALEHFGVAPEQAVMVGDSFEADVVGAHRVGMQAIWITRRAKDPATAGEAPVEAVVRTLAEVPAVIQAE
jgi:putative hydrolase of the HAD superfamily